MPPRKHRPANIRVPQIRSAVPGRRTRRTGEERAIHVLDSVRLYVRGMDVPQIAALHGVSPATVSQEIRTAKITWKDQAYMDFDERISEELAKIAEVETNAWIGWEESRLDKVVETTERLKAEDGTRIKTTTRREGQSGNPQFLNIALAAQERRQKLLGLDAPIKINPLVDQEAERVAEAYGVDKDELLAMTQKLVSGWKEQV